MEKYRRGLVKIDMKVLRRDRKTALAMSRDLVIWRIDENIMMDTITWWAESEHFDLIEEGTIPPEYTAQVTASIDGKIEVTWIKN